MPNRRPHDPRFRRTAPVVFAGLAALTAATCSDPAGPEPGAPITQLPRPLTADERRVVETSNAFAFELGRRILPEAPGENLFYSPLSASFLLGLVLNGADGATYDQIRSVLGLDGMDQAAINAAYSDLVDLLLGLDPAVTVEIGNSVWTQAGFPVAPDYLARVEEAFRAEAAEVDFGDPATLDRINGWASDATHGRIEKIFDALPANTVAALLNALYFQADWRERFDEDGTVDAPFTRPDGSVVQAPLMRRDGPVRAALDGDVRVLELPYAGGAFVMTVVLPPAGTSGAEQAAAITPERWDGWIDSMAEGDAVVHLPRFELKWGSPLNGALMELGMTDAFEAGVADFSRLTPGGGPWLGLVQQRAFVRVDEKGTEAAAVTGAIVPTSMPPEYRVDRSFVFALRERLSGTILFLGVINDPTG